MRPIAFFIMIVFVIAQRLWELKLAGRNTRLLIEKGGIEFGREHYWLLVVLHSFFFLSLIIEALVKGIDFPPFAFLYFLIFLLAQGGRVWVIHSLGSRWTTRVVVLPGEKLVRRGPFRFIAHPNYCVVALELAFLPLAFRLTATAVLFTVLNALVLLGVRIPLENKALSWARAQ